jgi:hypothetical protein
LLEGLRRPAKVQVQDALVVQRERLPIAVTDLPPDLQRLAIVVECGVVLAQLPSDVAQVVQGRLSAYRSPSWRAEASASS